MKNRMKLGVLLLMTLLGAAACVPQYDDGGHELGIPGAVITSDQISFTGTPSATNSNVFTFTSTSDIKIPHTLLWDFGNGTTSRSKTPTAQYPFAGKYTVTLTIYTADGAFAAKSEIIAIEQNDYKLLNTLAYKRLAGELSDTEGKTWVFDQYNHFAKEVADATGKIVKGHIGLGPQGDYGQDWWGAGSDEKSALKMYDLKFTFTLFGTKLVIESAGEGYGRKATSASVGGFDVTKTEDQDVTFDYLGGNYTFAIDESGTYPALTLSKGAIMGYYCGTQTYEIFYQTDKVMALRVNNTAEEQDWVFVYCLEELNIGIVKEPKAVFLFEDFESSVPSVIFEPQDMGSKSGISDNPERSADNPSKKVYRYEKSESPSSNLSFTAPDYKFDLSKQNKIRVKVFIPSSNNFDKEWEKEDWGTSKNLLPRLTVKLYDSSSNEPWSSQKELIKDVDSGQFDQWVDLVYDFSGVADNTDYDKIVIQFGQEGHFGTGTFYFDDFMFSE